MKGIPKFLKTDFRLVDLIVFRGCHANGLYQKYFGVQF